MAMHHSRELVEVVRLLDKEIKGLGIQFVDATQIVTDFSNPEEGLNTWITVRGMYDPEKYHVPYFDHPLMFNLSEALKKGQNFYTVKYLKAEKNRFYRLLFKYSDFGRITKERQAVVLDAPGLVESFVIHKNSALLFMHYGLNEFSAEDNAIFRRFGAVFEQAYTRFLDLQKAEAQARESEIQLALERVRASTMAMHKSNELAETAAILFQQMTELGVTPERINICLIKEADNILEVWATDQQGVKISHHFNASLDEPTTGKPVYDAWKEKKKSIIIDLSGKELNDWIRYVREVMGMTIKAELVKEHRIHSVAFFSQGMILTTTPEPLPEESITLLERFADVFNLTYRRFLDLQKAETQARDAQIEAALERVRSLALGMRKSEEAGKVTDSFFAEFKKLTVKIIGCSIIVADEKNDSMEIWRARSDLAVRPFSKSSFSRTMNVTKESMPELFPEYRKALGSKKGYMQAKLSGEKRLRFLNINSEQNGFNPRERERFIKTMPAQFVASFLFFKLGYLALISEKELPEENLKIARRFADVFDFAYTRFLDLQKAEAQARDAIKQASLDRVRGEIASMRTTEDLNRITPVIWNELKTLDVPFIRCGVFIINEDQATVQVYLSKPDGQPLAALSLPFESTRLTRESVAFWREGAIYKEHWNRDDFIRWMQSLIKMGQVQSAETYQGADQAPESLDLHFLPFTQGMLYVGNTHPLTEDEIELVQSLAETFSVAYARYEDFKNLEKAKNKIEQTLSELKATQSQLIQAEKMASLGELTAGIAHEIQNPLNFVNNFSEVSTELLEEMKEEIENGDLDEVKAITEDVIQNLEKILHHGRRADGIVKGMLQHSRGSSGQKEPTDINALCDEYLRLSYHGLRARDQSFTADFKLEADEKLPRISVVPQDIGRVLLNLINNAFYAVSEKAKQNLNGYKPSVIVGTQTITSPSGYSGVEIRVKDNGPGIPDEVKKKIFQPFFTTKPTGQGTGLGLSMSYDIVKAHGGELKLETKEDAGSTFIIQIPA